LAALRKLAVKIKAGRDLTIDGIKNILHVYAARRSAGMKKALQKLQAELVIQNTALLAVQRLGVATLGNYVKGMQSSGKEREDALVSIRTVGWAGVDAVNNYLAQSAKELEKAWSPVTTPDQALKDQRRDVEEEVARRFIAENGMRTHSAIRADVLDERERGEAATDGTLWAGAWSAGFVITMQPISRGLKVLESGVTAIPEAFAETVNWAFTGQLPTLPMTRALQEGRDISAYTGSQPWTFQRTMELGIDLLSGAIASGGGIGAVDEGIGGRASVHGVEAASASAEGLRGVTIAVEGSRGALYTGRLAVLNKLGLRQGYLRSLVVNFDELAGKTAVEIAETEAHEGFHVLVNRYWPNLRDAARFRPGGVPVTAPLKFLEESVAYSTGYVRSGQYLMTPLGPVAAPWSLSAAENLTIVAEGAVGYGVYQYVKKDE
jgi:hypothetical protein